MKKQLSIRGVILVAVIVAGALSPKPVAASKLGVHVLEPEDIEAAGRLLPDGGFVTIPIRLDQLDPSRWQHFFDQAADRNLIPILRLATRAEGDTWLKPTRFDLIRQAQFLAELDWKTDDRIVILYNEPNHAAEWGGAVDPDGYGRMLSFAVSWFHTESHRYLVLPAALDEAAPDGRKTMSAPNFLAALLSKNADGISRLDAWNSHAYPNPGFSGLPTDNHRQSVRSYQYELDKIAPYVQNNLPVFITETGWDRTKHSDRTIASYFESAYRSVWELDPRVVSVTPFLLNAQSGPFEKFSLLGPLEKPTAVYEKIKDLSSSKNS